MVQRTESNKSFFGLLLYLSSHLLCIYYLLWILISTILDHAHRYGRPLTSLELELTNFRQYFPDSKYRIVLPGIILGAFLVYSLISFGLMWSKRQQAKRIVRERIQKEGKNGSSSVKVEQQKRRS